MKTKLFFLALWLFAISCNNDDRMSDSTIIPQTKYSYDLSKNLILIKGKKSDVKNLVYSEKSSFLENSYEKGFIPLLVSSEINNAELYSTVLEKQSKVKKLKIFESNKKIYSRTSSIEPDGDTETFLEDEDFASLLNDKGQIQVNDSIYMYTPNGLFISHVDDYDDLEEFVTENPQVSVPEGLTPISEEITSFSPTQEYLSSFEMIEPLDPYDGSGSYSGGYGGTSTNYSIPSTTPSHYYNCNSGNANTPFIANLFGNQYVCNYYFDNKYKVKTVFEVLDFYLFNSVRAKTKMRKKGWTGIWGREDASKLYLKINTAVFGIERKTYNVSISTDWQNIVAAYRNIFGNNKQQVAYEAEEYQYNSSQQNYSKKVFYIQPNDFNYMNSNFVYSPYDYTSSTVSTIGDYRKIMNTSNKDVIVVVNLFNIQDNAETTLQKIVELAKPIFQKHINSGKAPSQIAIAFNEMKIYKDKNNIVDVKPMYIITKDELITVNNDHKVIHDFEIKKNFNLEGLEIGFSKSGNNSPKIKFKVVLGYNKVTKFKVDMEGGALYNNKWGGSKFSVEKN
jgi:hypothetical protein